MILLLSAPFHPCYKLLSFTQADKMEIIRINFSQLTVWFKFQTDITDSSVMEAINVWSWNASILQSDVAHRYLIDKAELNHLK